MVSHYRYCFATWLFLIKLSGMSSCPFIEFYLIPFIVAFL